MLKLMSPLKLLIFLWVKQEVEDHLIIGRGGLPDIAKRLVRQPMVEVVEDDKEILLPIIIASPPVAQSMSGSVIPI